MEKLPSSMESADEEVFNRYIEDLRLSPEDFEKKILDVGSASASFANYAKEHGISSQIYSVEPRWKTREKEKAVQGRSEKLPFKDEEFDLVISNAAVPNVLMGKDIERVKERVSQSLLEFMRVAKPGGEVRLGRVIREDSSMEYKNLSLALDAALEELRRTYKAHIEEFPDPDILSRADYKKADDELKELLIKTHLIKIYKPKLE